MDKYVRHTWEQPILYFSSTSWHRPFLGETKFMAVNTNSAHIKNNLKYCAHFLFERSPITMVSQKKKCIMSLKIADWLIWFAIHHTAAFRPDKTYISAWHLSRSGYFSVLFWNVCLLVSRLVFLPVSDCLIVFTCCVSASPAQLCLVLWLPFCVFNFVFPFAACSVVIFLDVVTSIFLFWFSLGLSTLCS